VLIGLISVLAFLPALGGQFITWDDDVNFVTNPWYRGLGWPEIRWTFSNLRMGRHIPITWLSFSASYAAGGMNPLGYHLVSLLLHGVNAITLYVVARHLIAASRVRGPPATKQLGEGKRLSRFVRSTGLANYRIYLRKIGSPAIFE
jgi:hypothetical protein